MNICHVFTFITEPERAIEQMARFGFQESYRRQHPGQGTENVCYCFDNMYLELLWVNDASAFVDEAIAPLQFDQRSTTGNPFGIALRGDVFPFDHHHYHAPYLPKGMSIPFAKSSNDVTQPFLFLSPGSKRPDEWDVSRQESYGEVSQIGLSLPQAHSDYMKLEKMGLINLENNSKLELSLVLADRNSKDMKVLSLPKLELRDF